MPINGTRGTHSLRILDRGQKLALDTLGQGETVERSSSDSSEQYIESIFHRLLLL